MYFGHSPFFTIIFFLVLLSILRNSMVEKRNRAEKERQQNAFSAAEESAGSFMREKIATGIRIPLWVLGVVAMTIFFWV